MPELRRCDGGLNDPHVYLRRLMARKWKSKIVVEIRLPDGGWLAHPRTEKLIFKNMPEAQEWISERIRPGEVMRVAKVSGEFFIKQELVKR
tara:strand:+ start:171 stop:443 length:273 start_codon:yes stop_codon:yes gene_type:complete